VCAYDHEVADSVNSIRVTHQLQVFIQPS
jgi:hypothetical protein